MPSSDDAEAAAYLRGKTEGRLDVLQERAGAAHARIDTLEKAFADSSTKQGARIGVLEIGAVKLEHAVDSIEAQAKDVAESIKVMLKRNSEFEGSIKTAGFLFSLLWGIGLVMLGWWLKH